MVEHPPSILTNVLFGAAALGSAIWAVYEKVTRMKVQSANNDAAVSMASGQETLFSLMSQRLATLETEMITLRQELEEERKRRRSMEEYVFVLQDSMQASNIPVPTFQRSTTT